MSAFICSDRHIATIARFAATGNPENVQKLANQLKCENIRSVNYRYDKKTRVKPCDISDYWEEANIHDVLKMVRCLDYQSCERADYEGVLLDVIENMLLKLGANPALSNVWDI